MKKLLIICVLVWSCKVIEKVEKKESTRNKIKIEIETQKDIEELEKVIKRFPIKNVIVLVLVGSGFCFLIYRRVSHKPNTK